MTIEITNTEDFSSKLAFFFAGIQKLERAGIDTDPAYFESMVEDFLVQFEATTLAPAPRYTAGWVIINNLTGGIPSDFEGVLYDSQDAAQGVLDRFLGNRAYLSHHDYRVVVATYFA